MAHISMFQELIENREQSKQTALECTARLFFEHFEENQGMQVTTCIP
jgi:hypothetical protein